MKFTDLCVFVCLLVELLTNKIEANRCQQPTRCRAEPQSSQNMRILGCSGGVVGGSWVVLGRAWGVLGAALGRSSDVLGAKSKSRSQLRFANKRNYKKINDCFISLLGSNARLCEPGVRGRGRGWGLLFVKDKQDQAEHPHTQASGSFRESRGGIGA
jgi:hypothetical protein